MAAPSPQPPGNAADLSALQPRLQGLRFPFLPHPHLRVREMLPKHALLANPAPVPEQGDPAQMGLVNPKDAQVGQHRIEGRGTLLGRPPLPPLPLLNYLPRHRLGELTLSFCDTLDDIN